MQSSELPDKTQNSPTNYQIKKFLSKSKFEVYLAHSHYHNNQCVLKIYSHNNSPQKAYENEVKALSKLKHSNIIQLIDQIDESHDIIKKEESKEKISFLVLKYAKYGDFLDIIKTCGPMPEKLARSVFIKLLEGLSYLHEQKIAHMDIKPENILLDEDFEVIYTDFDMAQNFDDERIISHGTPGFRAPEIRSSRVTNHAALDIFSLGVVLFILKSKNPPFQEKMRGLDYFFDAFYRTMRNDSTKFWNVHSEFHKDSNFYSSEFKDLFDQMVKERPDERIKMEDLLNHPWVKSEESLSKGEFKIEMQNYLKKGGMLN